MVTPKVKYLPVDDEINGAVAIAQAASAIDLAVTYGIESKSAETLLTAASLWIDIAERLGVGADESEEESDDKKDITVISVGFSPANKDKEVTADGTSESKGRVGL